jgi:hypothetical protein
MALELGISVKTLWGWETDRWQSTPQGQKQIARFLLTAVVNGRYLDASNGIIPSRVAFLWFCN